MKDSDGIFNPFRKEERAATSKMEDLEDDLLRKLKSGEIKVGSPEWRKQCEEIERLADLAIRLEDEFNERA